MARRYASFYPQRVNMWFGDAAYAGHGAGDSPHIATFDFGTPSALNATGLLSAQSIGTAGNTTTLAAAYVATEAQMGRWGRNVTVVASGAAITVVRVFGRDYMGQPIREHLTLNGATIVQGVRAFRYIDEVDWDATAATTINLGIGNYHGLPFKCYSMISEIKNSAISANAGTFVAGLATTTAATSTTTDPRGLYLPVTVIPTGAIRFEIRCATDPSNLLGNQHYYLAL
jgi:hypothetical protein